MRFKFKMNTHKNTSQSSIPSNKIKSYEMIINDSTNVSRRPRTIDKAEKMMYNSYAQDLLYVKDRLKQSYHFHDSQHIFLNE